MKPHNCASCLCLEIFHLGCLRISHIIFPRVGGNIIATSTVVRIEEKTRVFKPKQSLCETPH